MTFLQLVNNVLTRLREDNVADLESPDPYIRSIMAHVNDAKDRVEDAWQWAALRGADVVDLSLGPAGGEVVLPSYELPNSADNHYVIKGMYWTDTSKDKDSYAPVRWISKEDMIAKYLGGDNVPFGKPQYFCANRVSPITGNILVAVYPQLPVGTPYRLVVDRVVHQPTLDGTVGVQNPDGLDRNNLLVPSLPVYTLATALASRERGEVGGTPTSELFTIANRHLSDAIAQDSALFANELDWYSGTHFFNTNVKFA